MSESASNAVRGSIGFAIGILVATSLAFLRFPLTGLILGGALAGTLLAWKFKDVRLITLSAIGVGLGLLLGGLVVVMSFGVLAYGRDEVSGPPTMGVLLGFYSVFIIGFGVVGASISAATASFLVSLSSGITAFSKGGVIGGTVIVAAELMKFNTAVVVFAAVTISIVIAGAFCGASLNKSEEVSCQSLSSDLRLRRYGKDYLAQSRT